LAGREKKRDHQQQRRRKKGVFWEKQIGRENFYLGGGGPERRSLWSRGVHFLGRRAEKGRRRQKRVRWSQNTHAAPNFWEKKKNKLLMAGGWGTQRRRGVPPRKMLFR